jgi:hypothetical protein
MQYTERRRTDDAMFKSKKVKPQTMTLQNDTFHCYQIVTFVNKMIDWVVSLHHACSVERVKKWGNWYIEQNHLYPSSSPVFCGARVAE